MSQTEPRKPAPDAEAQDYHSTENDWLEAIGPEGMSRDEKVENLKEYGFDLEDEDEVIDLPTPQPDYLGYKSEDGDDPDEVGDELGSTLLDADDNSALRPVEDEAIDDLDEDAR